MLTPDVCAPPAGLSPEARHKLCLDNLPLARWRVRLVRRRFRGGGLSEDDLLSAALYGLARAAALFDPSRDASFSTFATSCIRWALCEEIASRGLVRVPQRMPRGERERLMRELTPVSLSDLDREGKGAVLPDRRPEPHAAAEAAEHARATAARLLGRLDEQQRQALWLHGAEGLSYAQAGERMGVSRFQAAELCRAAVRRLRLLRLLGPAPPA